jgi:hypothetical protein
MATKLYQLFCELCNWKKITQGNDADQLHQHPTSPIPTTSPKLEDNKSVVGKSQKQPKKFRCPQCGRLIIPKIIDDPQAKLDEQLDAEQRMKHRIEEEEKIKEEIKKRNEQSKLIRNKTSITQ